MYGVDIICQNDDPQIRFGMKRCLTEVPTEDSEPGPPVLIL